MAEVDAQQPPTDVKQLDTKEINKLQAMFGNPKQQEAKYYLNESGKKESIGEDVVKPQATVFFKNCRDCEYVLDAMCTKVLIEGCHNTKIIVNGKIVTSTVEIYKSDNFSLAVNTKIGTLQTDICNDVQVEYQKEEHLGSIIWAGVENLALSFQDSIHTIEKLLPSGDRRLETGFKEMEKIHPELRLTIDQFIIRFVEGQLLSERMIRLDNGFPTTEREKKVYDQRQEEALQILAKEAGITIGRKAEKKIPPNSVCPKCKSGKKYKKCCGKL